MLHLLPEKGIRCVYFVCSLNQILYIGQTLNIRRRVSQHANKGPDQIFILPCQSYGWDAERKMIKACRPMLNKSESKPLTRPLIGVKDLEEWHLTCVKLARKGKFVGIVAVENPTQ